MTSCQQTLTLNPRSLFEATFLYKDSSGTPIDLTGLVDEAEFNIYDGDEVLAFWTVGDGDITITPEEGRFDLLIPEGEVELLDFSRARFQFRILWNSKGWQEIGGGDVIMDE